MRPLFIALVVVLSLAFAPGDARAQSNDKAPATLIANALSISGTDQLIADGAVEIHYQGRRLTAHRLVYDRSKDSLTIDGPITLTDGSGTVILASQAELKADMTEGILRSARVVMNQQMQLAAAEVMRVDGRYTAMTRVVASSCKVCEGDPTPLWEIRAARVVHDQQERQIYFDQPSLRFGGVPVLFLPRLRMPDPTLTRATGFLMPSLQSSSNFGTGLRWPYFIKLGDSRDLTLTPFLTTKGAKRLELRYRQAFRTGEIALTGIAGRDKLIPGKTRGLVSADGRFDLPKGFELRVHGEAVSDRAYLLDYGQSDKDRLTSSIEITRTRANEHIAGRFLGIQTLRAGEPQDTLTSVLGDITWKRRFSLGPLGGQGGLTFQTHSHARTSSLSLDPDADGLTDGRDVARGRIKADWRRDWIAGNGMVFGILGEATADIYRIGDVASAYGGTHSRTHGAFAAELRWPLLKAGRNGVTHVLEPVAQLVWAPKSATTLANEDSVLVEFDQGNLFALNRFPGADAVERGARANIGLNYLRQDPAGWGLGLTFGRVLRADTLGQFTAGSGLGGRKSDWLAASRLTTAGGLGLTNRFLLDDAFDVTKAEMLLSYDQPRLGLDAGYLYHKADPAEGRAIDTNEIVFDGRFAIGQAGWQARVMNRYDLEADRASNAGVGLTFRNECLSVDLSLSRRFTSSTSVSPTTDFSVSLELLGFGGAAAGPSRQCRG
ncbi:MAG: LPS-assembly protein LptD [Pseudorhodobacter sp.]|nr:MAG: LPS-assembly protein LptD [Pseudorhodobacter sp.]